MTVTSTPVVYCEQCGERKLYIAFKPDNKIKLQCIKCDNPNYKDYIIMKEQK